MQRENLWVPAKLINKIDKNLTKEVWIEQELQDLANSEKHQRIQWISENSKCPGENSQSRICHGLALCDQSKINISIFYQFLFIS